MKVAIDVDVKAEVEMQEATAGEFMLTVLAVFSPANTSKNVKVSCLTFVVHW
jgi:hypothetical protein